MTRRRGFTLLTLSSLAGLALYLFAWPVPIEPQAWNPPLDPGMTGPYATNDALRETERLFVDEIRGPDFILVDRRGRLVTAANDGRVMQLDVAGGTVKALGLAGGRPLGFVHSPVDAYLVADPIHGLGGSKGRHHFEFKEQAGLAPVRYASDLVITGRGDTYYLDASSRFGYGQSYSDFLEHGANGRLLKFDDIARTTTLVRDGLYFPSGLVLGPDDAYLLIAETSAYRVTRYWLSGEKAGQSEVFIDKLPGFPAHITWNGKDTFWLALYSSRIAAFDRWAGQPWLRKVIHRLPVFMQPKPSKQAFVLGLNTGGTVTHNLQYAGADAYAPITSAREHEGWLYLGSLTERGVGRIRKPATIDGTTPQGG